MTTLQEIFSQLDGARYFSVLDASSAFLQIPLSENSSRLCTIATPFGRFSYCRLPFGLNSSPEIFQKAMDHVTCGLEGVSAYIDDVLVFGNSKEEHDERLAAFLEKARYFGLKLSKEKSQIGRESVQYLGHKLTPQGISITECKLKAIQDYPSPRDKNYLQRFLGMITYVGRFIDNLSDKTGPLRLLMSKNKSFIWTSIEQKCFEALKEEITKVPVLAYFDGRKKSTLSVDASKFGLGAVVFQNDHPIGYSSSALTATQQRYSQIEKELLAVVNGCKKFHYYLYGTDFTIETDHKPLLGLLNKPIASLSPRLQRMMMELMRYNFKLVHVPVKKMFIADSLSRAPIDEHLNTSYLDNGAEVVYSLAVFANDDVVNRHKYATERDAALKQVRFYIEHGWPEHKQNCDDKAHPFWEKRYQLHLYDDLIYMEDRLVIPSELRPDMLRQLHASHQGINSCQNRAQMAWYWPGMMRDIKNTVDQCTTCQEYQRSNPKEPLKPYPVPEIPWEEIGVDFFKINNTNHMLVIDYHSKFVEVKKMSTTTADSVTAGLTQIFRSHGLPKKLHSDNGPPFDSHKFSTFTERYKIEHITSSPYYPKSNGMVERAIQTLKSMLSKTLKTKGDPNLAIIDYNNTPKANLRAPAQMLMGRLLKTVLPATKDSMKPLFPTNETVLNLKQAQEKQKTYYDRSAHLLPELKEGEEVYVQKGTREWAKGKVVKKHKSPNSYFVQMDSGAVFRRNRCQLRQFKMEKKKD
ncbi:uncharacterized protein K02A2.6-like [Macrosteles quadrilineatus]|uniref:uncharacterized protein K02A2.6-like n=1 Tax=Macrosteles quadrilineatus TaxID=74068 RepID=UPI0023E1D4DC|nr:uncharacterized protein K02A2.6-like [Macrosteles quadrilineatus]